MCLLNVLSKFEEKSPPNNPKIGKGFFQLIRMGNSIRLKWVDDTGVNKANLWLYFLADSTRGSSGALCLYIVRTKHRHPYAWQNGIGKLAFRRTVKLAKWQYR